MSPIKPTIKTEILPIIFIIMAIILSFYFYANFPEKVPIHWNVAGEVDNWGSAGFAAFLLPAVILGMYLLFLGIPYLDPKKDRYQEFRQVYHAFKTLIILFMLAIYLITSLNGLGYSIAVGAWVPVMVGLLFIIIGSYLPKIKTNWFIGIRTPWTLSSETVWQKTHQFGSKVFIVGGILMMLEAIVPVTWRIPLFILILAITLLGTLVYSYWLYRAEEKKKEK